MRDYEVFPPLAVARASGPFLYASDGRRIIDAISSWWCKSLGHGHPRIRRAVQRQIKRFEHVIAANTTSETIEELSERLSRLMPGLGKVFYGGDGSTAVEIACKMSLQFHRQTGSPARNKFISLENGYHGETVFTLSLGDCGLYSAPFKSLARSCRKIINLPYVSGKDDPGWSKMDGNSWENIKIRLDAESEKLAAIVFEPVLQGAGGMLIYSPDLLRKLRGWAEKNKVHLIADEIMTGFGRTGRMLACEHAGIRPDFICLSKGMTAGWAPMSAVLTSSEIYDAFYGDYLSGKAFLHSNTYCGYAIGAAAALEALKIYEDEKIIERVDRDACELRGMMENIAAETGALRNIRSLGFVCAADLVDPSNGRPYPRERRIGFRFFTEAVRLGAFLRPLGDTIYFLPPLNISKEALHKIGKIAQDAVSMASPGK